MSDERPVVINSTPNYPNASYSRSGEPAKEVKREKQQPIVSEGRVSIQKKSAWRRAKHKILAENGEQLKNYIVDDVLIPTIKNTAYDIIANAANILLFGEPKKGNRPAGLFGGRSTYGNYVSYNNISSSKPVGPGARTGIPSATSLRNGLALDDFVFETRREAIDVLDRLSTILTDYGVVTVADLYDLCNLRCPYTYNNYAWRDLSTAGVNLTRNGYLLSLPTPHTLD